jgi:hypothetical protein
MSKKLFIICAFLGITPTFAAEKSSSSVAAIQTIEVTEETASFLAAINKDAPLLHYYCVGLFRGMGERPNITTTPSQFLKQIFNSTAVDESKIGLNAMTGKDYINEVVLPTTGQKLDADFQKKVDELKDRKATWSWFEEHFKTHGIMNPFNNYREKVIKADQQKIDFARHGIFLSNGGKTAVISPAHAWKKLSDKESEKKDDSQK